MDSSAVHVRSACLVLIAFGLSISETALAKPPQALTSSERAWLETRSTIVLAGQYQKPPYGFTNAAGVYQGICADYIDLLAQRLGIRIEIVANDTRQRIVSRVKTKILDGTVCISGIAQISGYLFVNDIRLSASNPDRADLNIGIRRDLPTLNGIFQKTLNEISPSDHQTIRQRWLTNEPEPDAGNGIVTIFLGLAVTALAIACLWNIQLRRRNRELIRSDERFQLAMSATSDGLWDWDISTDEVYFSPVYMRMLGYQPGELPASENTWVNLLHPDDKHEAIAIAKKAVRESSPAYEHEFRLRAKNGEYRYIHSRGSIAKTDGQGRAMRAVGTQRDVTERKKVETELEAAKVDAERANRFKGDFLANMSHEIRTPMNAIIGLCHLALQTRLSAQQRDYLHKIQSSSHSLLGIINDVLDFSKIESGKLRMESIPFDIGDVMENLADLFRFKAEEKNLELLFDIGAELPKPLIGDPLRLGQVLTNLTSNAVKFTERGEIVVAVDIEESHERSTRLRFSVADTGSGVKAEHIPKLFESFYQGDSSTTRTHGGTGLGLAICKQLVTMMNGEIGARSEPGKGSCFYFTAEFGLHAGLQKPAAHADLKDLRVLVVDDNATARQVLSEMFESFNFKVSTAATATAALHELESASNTATLRKTSMD